MKSIFNICFVVSQIMVLGLFNRLGWLNTTFPNIISDSIKISNFICSSLFHKKTNIKIEEETRNSILYWLMNKDNFYNRINYSLIDFEILRMNTGNEFLFLRTIKLSFIIVHSDCNWYLLYSSNFEMHINPSEENE